ncbi:uncharacterized protein LOC107262789 [Cephus cinctus]|uniref:Uncharacterized protein LOC107262789 n=1 Tax=Cephus cinctus TaxID=211228 RepID=A0AAJ7BFL8_CEPCN|nr:uncharacterized protein LOC107262789 [Cephus cinctus]
MADPGIRVFSRALLFAVLFLHVFSNPVNIPLQSVSDLLIQSALNSLNEDSPTRHTYKGGNLISAQKLLEPPYVIYRLTLNLEPECDGDSSSCPREACAINLKQHELGVIEVQQSSIQCMYLYPQVQEDEVNRVQQMQQESSLDMNLQDQDVIESLDKQILNQSVELDHEVQTAADQNDEPFIAVRASNLKYCPGCPYELNPTLPGLSAFAEQAVQSMDEAGQTDYKHKLVSIVRVTRAVPPGSNVVQYNLLLEIGESNCLNSTPIDRSECSLQSNIPIKLCQVTFEERPWQENSRQITKNNCTEGQGVENELSSSISPNIAADSLVSSRLNNQQSVQDVLVKTSNYDQLTQETKTATYGSLIDELFGNPVNTTVVEITTEQTGTLVTEETLTKIVLNNDNKKEEAVFFNDKFKEFDEFLEDFNVSVNTEVSTLSSTGVPVTEEVIVAVKVNEENIPTKASSKDNKQTQVTNLNTYELNNSHSESNSSEEVQTSGIVQVKDSSEESHESAESKELPVALNRKKRALSSKLPQSEINFINELAKKAVDILDDIDTDSDKRIIVAVENATTIYSHGIIYRITMLIASTSCDENSRHELNCNNKIIPPRKRCKIEVHLDGKRLLHTAKVAKSSCCDLPEEVNNHVTRRRRGISGGVNAISVSDPEVLKYASMGLETFSANFEGPNEPILVEIQEASVQVVAGNLYKIKVKLGTSNCPKGTKNNCALKPDSETKICLIKVWSQPWLDEGSPDVKVNCDQTRKKREIPGGVNSISVSDPEVVKYASMGLQKFSANSEGPNEPILVEIQEASVQVVAGNLYKIKVKLGTSNCPKGTKNNCALKPDSETKICLIKVWSQPWLDKGSPDVKVNCNQTPRRKRSLRGVNYSLKMMNQAKYFKYEKMFQQFTQDFNKTYSSSKERKNRFEIFKKNLNVIEELQKNEQGTAKYGITMFADLSTKEFRKKYLGLRPDLKLENHIPMPMAEIPDNIELPTEFDWRDRHVVTEVKDQGQCGSCWAFSVTGNIESLYAIKYKKLLSLSEQELVDCDTLDQGCGGGLPDNAYRAIENLGGLELEKDYPYEAENEKCHFNKSKAKVVITSAVNITSNETLMAKWLVSNGPISIGINANAMQFYMGGVSHPYKFLCSPDNLDHGVLIVGYGIHTYPLFNKKLPYWTIKNSWGPRWGEQGYYRVYRGDGTCGVNQMASSAIVA